MSDNIGTVSILFDESRLCTNFSFTDNPNIDTNNSNLLTDPNSTRDALQQLRILKTRNTGSIAQVPITTGRDRRKNIDFDQFSYEEYKIRRKVEVLKNQNKSNLSKKSQFSRFSNGQKTKYMSYSTKKRLKALKDSNACDNIPFISQNVPISNGGKTLYFDPKIPFHDSL